MSDFDFDEELRRRLAGLDPMAGVPVEPHHSPQARHRLEQIMTTEIAEKTTSTRRWMNRGTTWLGAAAALAVVGLGVTAVVQNSGSPGGDEVAIAQPAQKSVLALQSAGGDPMMQMCMMFDVAQLRTAGVAFGGTVAAIDSEKVTLDVDRWFKGTPQAHEVTIAIPPGGDNVALDGVNFVQGDRYLISATDGVLGTCGYSGPASADLEKSFEKAFPAK